ncbi:MAG: hypothetical protein WB615_09710 [Candidatus Tumulicola sp.]
MKEMEAPISAYYHAIHNGNYQAAYLLWTPSLQKGLTPEDIANQWERDGATSVSLDITLDEPVGDFVGTTVHETDAYPGGYVRKQTFDGGWHVVNIGGRWLLNERNFKTVADNGAPPTLNADGDASETASAPIDADSRATECLSGILGVGSAFEVVAALSTLTQNADDARWAMVEKRGLIAVGVPDAEANEDVILQKNTPQTQAAVFRGLLSEYGKMGDSTDGIGVHNIYFEAALSTKVGSSGAQLLIDAYDKTGGSFLDRIQQVNNGCSD